MTNYKPFSNEIVIEVTGGIAYPLVIPERLIVTIIDRDTEEVGEGTGLAIWDGPISKEIDPIINMEETNQDDNNNED
jgi:hypothetical protein